MSNIHTIKDFNFDPKSNENRKIINPNIHTIKDFHYNLKLNENYTSNNIIFMKNLISYQKIVIISMKNSILYQKIVIILLICIIIHFVDRFIWPSYEISK